MLRPRERRRRPEQSLTDVEHELTVDFMLGWDPVPNCPATELPARGQVIENNDGPTDISRGYLASDPCIGPTC